MENKKVVLKVIKGGAEAAVVQDSLPFAPPTPAGATAPPGTVEGPLWVSVEEALPEEGETVLVCTEDYAVGFGYLDENEWQVITAPWCFAPTREPEVYYWMLIPRLPWPSVPLHRLI